MHEIRIYYLAFRIRHIAYSEYHIAFKIKHFKYKIKKTACSNYHKGYSIYELVFRIKQITYSEYHIAFRIKYFPYIINYSIILHLPRGGSSNFNWKGQAWSATIGRRGPIHPDSPLPRVQLCCNIIKDVCSFGDIGS